MKASAKSTIGCLLGVVAALIIDYVWYSGLLPWQAEANRDISTLIITSVILAVFCCLFYGAFYDGTEVRDVAEFSLMFTVMHLALSADGMSGGSSFDPVKLIIDAVHSFILLFIITVIEHQAKRSMKSGRKFK